MEAIVQGLDDTRLIAAMDANFATMCSFAFYTWPAE